MMQLREIEFTPVTKLSGDGVSNYMMLTAKCQNPKCVKEHHLAIAEDEVLETFIRFSEALGLGLVPVTQEQAEKFKKEKENG